MNFYGSRSSTSMATSGIRHILMVSVFCLGATVPALSQTYSTHPESLQPRIEAGAKVGTERSMGTMEGWAPLVQDDNSVLYTDIRWMLDDEENQEGNLGLGYRVMQGDHIVGGHAWIDRRRTDRGSTFYQVTGGVEFLKENWDIKANAYVPLNTEKTYQTPNGGNASPYLSGTGIFVDTNGQLIEEAQPGGDIELGYRLPIFEDKLDAVRVYGGGYGFIGNRTDDVVGGRVRASVDINPLINVGARFQYDEPRGSQGFIEATLRFPFTAKKRFQQHGLRARLDESPERDIDIVTNATVTDSGLRKEVLNVESGQIQRVLHVDNSAAGGGNGSAENPYNTLAAAQAAMADYDVIYVHRGNGTSTGMDQGIVVNRNNVQLIGSGTDFIFDTDKFVTRRPGITPADGTVIVARGAAPVITNNQAFVNDGQGTMTSNTGNGIFVNGRDVSIGGIDIANVNASSIYYLADGTNSGNIIVTDVNTTNSQSGRGLLMLARNNGTIGNIDVADSTFTDNKVVGAGRGLEIRSNSAGANIGNVTLSGLDVTQSASRGIVIQSAGGNVGNITLNDITASNNTEHGIIIQSTATGIIGNINMTDVTTNQNTQSGLLLYGGNTGQIGTVNITNMTANLNGNYGINRTTVNDAAIGHVNIDHAVARQNTQSGIYLYAANNSVMSANVTHSTVNANQQSGFYINDDTVGAFNVNLGNGTAGTGGNRIFGNGISNYATYADMRIDMDNAVLSAQGNWWGQGTGAAGNQVVSEGGCPGACGTANTSGHLTTDPGP